MKLKNKYYKYKVGIVLGGPLMIPNRCRKAIELYNTRIFNLKNKLKQMSLHNNSSASYS